MIGSNSFECHIFRIHFVITHWTYANWNYLHAVLGADIRERCKQLLRRRQRRSVGMPNEMLRARLLVLHIHGVPKRPDQERCDQDQEGLFHQRRPHEVAPLDFHVFDN
jgi:hypothetical protein